MDRAVAYAVLLASSPVIAARGAVAFARTGRVFQPYDVVGCDGAPLRLWDFAGERGHSDLLQLVAVASGRIRFIGPRPLTPDQLDRLPADDWRRGAVPGVFSAHRLRQDVGIAYDVAGAGQAPSAAPALLSRDGLGLIARSVLASAVTGRRAAVTPEHLQILAVSIANMTMREALDWIFDQIRPAGAVGGGRLVCFVNPGCLNISVQDIGYRAVLHRADLVLPDGIGIKVATRMQGVDLRENVNGTDMFPRLCERAAQDGTPIYLLGAREGVAAAAADAMTRAYPGLRIVGTHHGYVAGEEDAVVADINESGARILLVAMGVPRQELWLERMRPRLAPAVLLGVGGLFDFYSGRIPRAPLWVREIGMEWAWRLAQEPGRMWRRYVIGNPLFLFRVWRELRTGRRPAPAIPAPESAPPENRGTVAPSGAGAPAPNRVTAAASAQATAALRVLDAVRAAAGRRRVTAADPRPDQVSADS